MIVLDALPCPWGCAGMLKLEASGPKESPPFWVECDKCGASGPPADDQTDALAEWNDRPQPVPQEPQGRPAVAAPAAEPSGADAPRPAFEGDEEK